MHRCLKIPELLTCIIEFTDTPHALVNLAVTRRSFSGIALDVLWNIYGDLVPLLKLMPADLWYQDGEKHRAAVLVMLFHLLRQVCKAHPHPVSQKTTGAFRLGTM